MFIRLKPVYVEHQTNAVSLSKKWKELIPELATVNIRNSLVQNFYDMIHKKHEICLESKEEINQQPASYQRFKDSI